MEQGIIKNTIAFVKKMQKDNESGHDWWHTQRVWKLSKVISQDIACDYLVLELGALLHDVADSKFHNGDDTVGPKIAREFLLTQNIDASRVDHVVNIIENISFKGGQVNQAFKSIELDVIQDADRLDAIGAIGIARTFNYGGYKNRRIYDPAIEPNLTMTTEEYKNSTAPTINHFYEKLLLLKDRMNTPKGKQLAEYRHEFMLNFLEQFYAEWNVEMD